MAVGETDDTQLLERLAADLDGAFESLVVAYQHRLYAFALRMTGSPQDAEEVAQDAFLRCYRALGGYPAERVLGLALRPWLYRIALNVCRNRLRGKRLQIVPLEGSPVSGRGHEKGILDLPDDRTDAPETTYERSEEREELARAVVGLPERYRTAVVLRYVQDLSYAEAAEVLGQPVGTVKANAHRGIKLLRARTSNLVEAAGDNGRSGDDKREGTAGGGSWQAPDPPAAWAGRGRSAGITSGSRARGRGTGRRLLGDR